MSIIFYHDEEQRNMAVASKEREEARLGRKIFTEIRPFSEFYLAEDYHQKYYLRQRMDLMKEFSAIFPDSHDFVYSTAAARVNGYCGGYGTPASLQKNLERLGLSAAGQQKLLGIADRGLVPGCPVPLTSIRLSQAP